MSGAKRVPWVVWIVVAVVIGGTVGVSLGPRARAFADIAMIFVKLLKIFATPLVFVAVLETVVRTSIAPRRAAVMLVISTMNALVAMAIAWVLSMLFQYGKWGALATPTASDAKPASESALGARVSSWLEPLMIGNLLIVIGVAIVAGLALRAAKKDPPIIGRVLVVLTKILGLLVYGVPVAVACIVAKVVGTGQLAVLGALGFFVIAVGAAMATQVFVYYSILVRVLLGRSPREFLRAAVEPLLTALSTGSSLATLPVTLRTLKASGVSDESARLAACVGTNLNHDGILLYEAMAAFFVASLYAVPLTAAAKIKIMLTSVAAAVGIAGVPEAGLITLSLVLSAAGLPLAAVPLLLPVDWLLGRMRAATNVASDMVVATVIDGGPQPDQGKLSGARS